MSTRKTTLFYALLIAVASLAVGMVLASRFDLTPASSAQTTIAVPPMNSAPIAGAIDAQTFRNIAKMSKPMVVNIQTQMKMRSQDLTDFFGGGGGSPDDLFHRFFGQPGQQDDQGQQGRGQGNGQRRQREQTTRAAGTGFIISKDGFILTNNHVVEEATKIEVGLFGDDTDVTYEAKVVGKDPLTDSALIQMLEHPKEPLPEAKFGDSSQMAAGDWVMAIGNPFNYAHTVTIGVISAEKRAFPVTDGRTNDMMQTDAAINPGNSGGPLLNIRGEVIGMNTAIFTDQRSANIGIGFATPINIIRDLLPQLRSGKITRGVIKVGLDPFPLSKEVAQGLGLSSTNGALLRSVEEGGPGDKAGLRPGDVVVEYNGKQVTDNDQLVSMVVATRPGSTVPVTIVRDKKRQSINVTVGELNLDEEQGRQARQDPDTEPTSTGFGMDIEAITPEIARDMTLPRGRGGAIVSYVNRSGPAATGGVVANDVILEVNRVPVTSVAEVARELARVQSGSTAFLLVWRAAPTGGQQVFLTLRKR